MEDKFETLAKDEVLSLQSKSVGQQLNAPCAFEDFQVKGYQFIELIKKKLSIDQNLKNSLFNEGIDCEALRLGKGNQGWEKGKVRATVTLEFCPDEPAIEEQSVEEQPTSSELALPLDNIRQC